MNWFMVLSVLVYQVSASREPVNHELSLVGTIPDPVETHVNCLRPFLFDGVVGKTNYCVVFNLRGSWRLGMPKFLKCHTERSGVFGVH